MDRSVLSYLLKTMPPLPILIHTFPWFGTPSVMPYVMSMSSQGLKESPGTLDARTGTDSMFAHTVLKGVHSIQKHGLK